MAAWLESHWYLLAALSVGGSGLACLIFLAHRAAEDSPRTFMSYLLLWPLIFEAERTSKKKTRVGFVVSGVAIGLILIVGGIAMLPRR